MKKIAVQGFSYEISDATVMATVIMTGVPSAKGLEHNGPGICLDGYSFIITNITKPPATIPDQGPYNKVFNATAEKARIGSKFVLRADDVSDDILAIPQQPGSPPTPSPVIFHLKITAAGQTKFSCN